MSIKAFDQLLIEYKNCIKITNATDYGDKSSVKKSNKAVKRMIEISKLISLNYSSRINDFAEFLKCTDMKTDLWAAHHILENMNYPHELEQKALYIIIKYSKEESIDGLGNKMWLKNWNDRKRV